MFSGFKKQDLFLEKSLQILVRFVLISNFIYEENFILNVALFFNFL